MNASGLSRWAEPVADDVGADATGGSATDVSSPPQADRSDPLRAPTRMAGNKRRTPIEAGPPETAVDVVTPYSLPPPGGTTDDRPVDHPGRPRGTSLHSLTPIGGRSER